MYFDIFMNTKNNISNICQLIREGKYLVYNDSRVDELIILITYSSALSIYLCDKLFFLLLT